MDRFEVVRSRRHKLLAAFMTLGDPRALTNQAALYLDCGVDILELGVPHANPFMDGPLVAQSMKRALRAGVTLAVARELLQQVRQRFAQTPLVLMGYGDLAPVIQARDGHPLADAVLSIGAAVDRVPKQVPRIAFVSNRAERHEIEGALDTRSYVMLQANRGKTGLRASLPKINEAKIRRVRRAGVRAPVLLGFGVSTPEQAALAVQFGADGVVIGSACLQAAERGEAGLREFLTRVRCALDAPAAFLQ
jgi:tryptophan synthase alpha chain